MLAGKSHRSTPITDCVSQRRDERAAPPMTSLSAGAPWLLIEMRVLSLVTDVSAGCSTGLVLSG